MIFALVGLDSVCFHFYVSEFQTHGLAFVGLDFLCYHLFFSDSWFKLLLYFLFNLFSDSQIVLKMLMNQ